MTSDVMYFGDVVIMFARQGIAISTIARALAIPTSRVEAICLRAKEAGKLHMMPPATADDPRSAFMSELTNLRAQLDEAHETIRQLVGESNSIVEKYKGVAGLTRKEAGVVSAILKHGRATNSAIYDALYNNSLEKPEVRIVHTLVCNVRRKLKPFGVEIGTEWGVGYHIDNKNKALFLALAEGKDISLDLPNISAPELQAAMADMVAQ